MSTSETTVTDIALEKRRLPSSLRLKVILTAFIAALVLVLGGVTLVLVSRIFGRLGPAIRADLGWKAQREAEELAQTSELSIVIADQPALHAELRRSSQVPDVLATVVVDVDDNLLASDGPTPDGALLFASPEGKVTETADAIWAWSAANIEAHRVGKVAVVVSTERLRQIDRLRIAVSTSVGAACLAAMLLSFFFVGYYLGPLIALTERALARLTELTHDLERRVQARTHELSKSNEQLGETLERFRDAQRMLVEASRKAGMADVATAVLHNVGNVLNNVNIASGMVADAVRASRVSGVLKLADLLRQPDVGAALAGCAKTARLPAYLAELATTLTQEQAYMLKELDGLQRNVDHIKVIVSTQQTHAKSAGGMLEPVSLKELVEDALNMNSLSNTRHRVQIVRDLESVPAALWDRHKVFQIIMNLLSNARHAILAGPRPEGSITVRLRGRAGDGVQLDIADTGCGVAPENMTQIFSHGFTTKTDGHGFGLHSSACAASELGGSLTCKSEGVGRGTVFTLQLPSRHLEVAA